MDKKVTNLRILIAGESGNSCLETSYYNSLNECGYEVELFDTKQCLRKYARFRSLGYNLHRFFPVEAWLRKANKEFAEFAINYNPNVIILFTGAEVLPGAIAYIKTRIPV